MQAAAAEPLNPVAPLAPVELVVVATRAAQAIQQGLLELPIQVAAAVARHLMLVRQEMAGKAVQALLFCQFRPQVIQAPLQVHQPSLHQVQIRY
jgi:hypothetical protein